MTKRLLFVFMLLLLGSQSWVIAQSPPQDTVEDFLDRWAEKDYSGMYDLIYKHTINGEPEFPEPIFVSRHERVESTLNINTITYTIRDETLQGRSAAVTYDITIVSDTYGELTDAGRVMRLTNVSNTWQIAWSTQDIFAGLTEGGEVRVQAQPRARATIYDRDGVPLAADGGSTVGVRTALSRMASERSCAQTVAAATRQPIQTIERRFANLLPDTVFFLAEIPAEAYQQYRNDLRNNCGVNDGFSSVPHRTYFGGNAVVHFTGYVSPVQNAQEEATYGAGALVGRSGIEASFNDVLAGEQDRAVRIIGVEGLIIRELASTTGTPPTPVQLTIDADLQEITADAMNDAFNYAVTNWGGYNTYSTAPGGAAVVLDVNNGDVLAMVSYPSFNPSLFNPAGLSVAFDSSGFETTTAALTSMLNDPRNPQANRAVSEQFSPGSVFKIITIAAALNEGVINPNQRFNCELEWDGTQYGDTQSPRPDWRVADGYDPAGVITPAEALMASCNPWFWEHGALLYRDVGADTIQAYSERMGMLQNYFVTEDGRRILREATGVVPIPTSSSAAINEAVGQGDVAISPLHMATVVAGIANGGTVYQPRLVQRIGGLDNTQVQTTYDPVVLNELGFEPGVLEAIQEGMCGVTTNEFLGTAYGRFINNTESEFSYTSVTAPYSSCGKTGTAETGANPNAWFVIYAPADDPEIAIAVMVEQSLEGSQVAAPIARRILDDYFNVERAPFPNWWNTDTFTPLPPPGDGGSRG